MTYSFPFCMKNSSSFYGRAIGFYGRAIAVTYLPSIVYSWDMTSPEVVDNLDMSVRRIGSKSAFR